MDPNLVSVVVWLAAFSIISHGADLHCRFCFKYYLESCDGTYRIEIGNIALSEQELKFTKHCSNEPWEKGHGIFGGSSPTSPGIPGNNFPMVTGRVPRQHPDDCVEGSVEKGSHQEINTDVENTILQQQYPSVQPRERPIHVEEGSAEFSIHHVNNINGENTVYKSQYPDGSKPDQDPGYSGEGSVGIGANNVINALHQSQYSEGSKPAQNPSYDGQESVYTGMNNAINLKGENTAFQPQYSKGFKTEDHPGYDGIRTVGIELSNIKNVKNENTIYQPQYLESFKPDNHPSYGRDGAVEFGLHNEMKAEDGNTIYQPQYLNVFKPRQYPSYIGKGSVGNGIHNEINKEVENTYYQPRYPDGYKLGRHPGYGGEGSVETGMHKSENTLYQSQYMKGFKLGQQSSYAGEGSTGNKLHSVINPERGNTNYQPDYPEYFQPGQQPSNAREGAMDSEIDHAIDVESNYKIYQQHPEGFKPNEQDLQLSPYSSYVKEGIVGIGSQHATNAEGKNTVYQRPYPESFHPGEFSSFTGEGPVVNGMQFDINSNSKNTVYQPQIPENFQPGKFSSYDREGSIGIGMHYVKNIEGENYIYQPQYPGGIKPGQYLSYDREGLVGTGMNNLRKPKYKNTVSQPHYPEFFQPSQNPSFGGEGSEGIGAQHAINVEGENNVYLPQSPDVFKPDQYPNNGAEGTVGIGIDNVINTEGVNSIYQPQYSDGSQPDQFNSFGGEGSLITGMNNVKSTTDVNTVYKPQYPDDSEPGQLPSYGVVGSVETGSHQEVNTDVENTVQGLLNPKILQPEQHPSYDEEGTVETGSHQIINTVQQPVYPLVIQSGQRPSYNGDSTVGIRTKNVINLEGNNAGYGEQGSDVENTVQQPGYPSVALPGQLPIFSGEGSADINSHHVMNYKGEKTVFLSQNQQGVKSGQIPSFYGEGSVETEMNHPHSTEDLQESERPTSGGEGTVENLVQHNLRVVHSGAQSVYPDHLNEYQSGDVPIKISGTHTNKNLEFPDGTKPMQQPNYFQTGQYPSNDEKGSVGIGMHHGINIEGEHSIYQTLYPEGVKQDQQPNNGVVGLVEAEINNLRNSKSKSTVNVHQYPQDFQPSQPPSFSGQGSIGIHNEINTEGEHTIYHPVYPEDVKPDQQPSTDVIGSVGIEINILKKPKDEKAVNESQFSEDFQPGQNPAHGGHGSIESGMHNVLNLKGEQTDIQIQHPESFQPGQHTSYDVETGSHQVINAYGENTVQQPEYPLVIQPGQRPSHDDDGTLGIRTENVINLEGSNAGYGGEVSDVENTVQQPGHPSFALPGHVTNTKGEITVFLSQNQVGAKSGKIPSFDGEGSVETGMHHPHNPEDLQLGERPTAGGEGTVENLVQHNLRVVHSDAQSEYPDHLNEYQSGDEPIKISGTHTVKNLEYPDGTKPMQQPNYQSGGNLVQVENLREEASGHQLSYPNENQSGQRVEEVSGGEEQPQLSDSESDQIGSQEFEFEHEQKVNHVSYPEVNSDNNMKSGGHIPGSVNIASLQEPRYSYLGMKGTPGLYQNGLLEPQALSGLQHTEVKQLGPVRYLSSGMLQTQSSEGMFGPLMPQNYLYKNPRQRVPLRGVLQYPRMPSRQKVVQHIVHHHVHMPTLAAGLSGMSAIIEKQKLAECLKKYGKACKKLLEKKFRIPENNWYEHYNKYVKPSQQNPMKDSYVDESAKKKLLYSQLYGHYDKQLSPYMKHIPKLEQSSSVESSEQFDENSINAAQLQDLLASKKEDGKYPYAPAYMRPYTPHINQENYQNMPPSLLFGNIPDYNSLFKSEKSAKQDEMKSLNDITSGGSSEGSSGKIYHKIVKKIRVRTRSKIRGRMSRRNNDEGTEDYEDENTTVDPNESVVYVEEEEPEHKDEEKNENADLVESTGKSDVTTEGNVGEKPN